MVKYVEICQDLHCQCSFNKMGNIEITSSDIKELDSLGINILDIVEEK